MGVVLQRSAKVRRSVAAISSEHALEQRILRCVAESSAEGRFLTIPVLARRFGHLANAEPEHVVRDLVCAGALYCHKGYVLPTFSDGDEELALVPAQRKGQ